MFKNYLKIASRNIARHKGYSVINIIGLSIGIAVCILLLLWVQDELSFDQFHKKKNSLYRIIQVGTSNQGETYGNSNIPYTLAPIVEEQFPEIKESVRIRAYSGTLITYKDKKFSNNRLLLAEPALFNMFDFPIIRGDKSTPLDDMYSLVITRDATERYFGDEDPIGKVVKINNKSDFTITAIVEDVPHNSTIDFDFIAPFKILGKERIESWSWESQGFVLLNDNASPDALSEKILNIISEYNPSNKITTILQPLEKIHLYSTLGNPRDMLYVYIFSAIGILVLLIACINFMNLTTARATNRIREVGIRKVVGASRKRLVRQFLIESTLMSFIALILAIMLAELFLPTFNNLVQKHLTLMNSSFSIIIPLFLITLITGIIAGSYPALYLSKFNPVSVLKSEYIRRKQNAFRAVLVVFQFSIAIALIISTLTIVKQLHYIKSKDLGWDRDCVIQIPYNNEIDKHYETIKEKLKKNTSIVDVTSSSSSLIDIGNMNPVSWETKEDDESVLFNLHLVDFNYTDFFNIELVAGRTFDPNLSIDSTQAYLANETAVRLMGLEDPVGKRFSMSGRWGYIIGVIKDIHFQSFEREIGPLILSPFTWWRSNLYVRLSPNHIKQGIDHTKKILTEFAPSFPFEFSFMDDKYIERYAQSIRVGSFVNIFAVLAIIVSSLGLIGLSAYTAEQRRKEISVRKTLGATPSGIVFSLIKDFLRWVLLSLVLACPLAYYAMSKFLGNYAYHISMPFTLFPVAGLIAILIAILATTYQALKVSLINPAVTLKHE